MSRSAVYLLAALVGCSAVQELAPSPDVVEDVGDAEGDDAELGPLASDDFAWCHREGVSGTELAPWCALLEDAPPEACPGMRKTCAEGTFRESRSGCGGGIGVPSGKLGEAPMEPETTPEDWDVGCDMPAPSGAHPVLRWVLALAVAALVALVLVGIARVLGRRERERPALDLEPVPVSVEGIEGDDDLPALPEDDLLARARRALEAGQLGDAVILARGAALRRLARRGVVRLHRARTDREYLRRVKREPEVQEALRTVLTAVEDHRWAERVLSRDAADGAVRAAGRILGAGLMLCLIWPVTARAADPRFGPSGDVAAYRILVAAGYEVTFGYDRLAAIDNEVDAVFIDLYKVAPREEDWDALDTWIVDGGIAVIGGDFEEGLPDVVASIGERRPMSRLETTLERDASLRTAGLPLPVWPEGAVYEFCGEPIWPWVIPTSEEIPEEGIFTEPCNPAVVTVTMHGAGWVVAVSDPRIFWNVAMVAPANQAFIRDVLRVGVEVGAWELPERPKVVLALVASQGADNPVQSLLSAGLLPFMLHLMAWWVLLALWRGWPFAPLREPEARGRQDFSDHVIALGGQWSQLGASRHAASAYARHWWERLGPRGLRAAAVRAGHDDAKADALVRHIEDLVDQPQGVDDETDRDIVEELWMITRHR